MERGVEWRQATTWRIGLVRCDLVVWSCSTYNTYKLVFGELILLASIAHHIHPHMFVQAYASLATFGILTLDPNARSYHKVRYEALFLTVR